MFWLFHDMSSGGYDKTAYKLILIEAESEKEAVSVFYSRFNFNPNRVTCSCCGEDYSISRRESIEDAFIFFDSPRYDSRLIIKADEIDNNEKNLDVPRQGYVWVD